jgi:Tol biopolymer transport system component
MDNGVTLDSLSCSREGLIVFTVLSVDDQKTLHSKLIRRNLDGSLTDLTNGASLDLHPSFSPDGKEVVYSSDRGGKGLNVWKVAANGAGGLTQLTNEKENNLWPCADATGKLYYERLVDNSGDPRIYRVDPGRIGWTELASGTQPRVSIDSSLLLICVPNAKSGKRAIYKLDDQLKQTDLSGDPNSDNCDAALSPNKRYVAFSSDRGLDENKRHNYDIWIVDVTQPTAPIQITSNGSWDDCPCWSPNGDALYFRSNRGGHWGIWRIPLANINGGLGAPPQ